MLHYMSPTPAGWMAVPRLPNASGYTMQLLPHGLANAEEHVTPVKSVPAHLHPQYVDLIRPKDNPRSILGELPANGENRPEVAHESLPNDNDSFLVLLQKERMQRHRIARLERRDAARLEMDIQNLNIKRNSVKPVHGDEPQTPHGRGDSEDGTPRTVDRAETLDGTPIYEFGSGTPGGICVYYMKGHCGLGNKCRYVHDDTDEGCIVKITGMPYNTSVKQVVDFFSPLHMTPERVAFIVSAEGKQTGSAFVEFETRRDALLALAKDKTYITSTRFVLLYPSSKIERAWYRKNPQPFRGSGGKGMGTPPGDAPMKAGACDLRPLQSSPFLGGAWRSPSLATPVEASPVAPQSTTPHIGFAPRCASHTQPSAFTATASRGADTTIRSLLPCLNAADEPSTPVKQLSVYGAAECFDGVDLLQNLSEKLQRFNRSVPSLLGESQDSLRFIFQSLGYAEEEQSRLLRDLQDIRRKAGASVPLSPPPPLQMPELYESPAKDAFADHSGMPTLLGLGDDDDDDDF